MDKEKLDELWKQVTHIGKVERLDYDAMVSLGSVFGQMRSEIERKMDNVKSFNIPEPFQSVIEKQQKEIENLKQYKKVLMENSVVRSETIEKYEKALRFYANKENYELWDEAEKANLTEFVNNLDMDKGETARKALGE